MTIKRIEIDNVRGIDSLEVKEDVFANKPNIIVASNGFGKTSIATAFRCLADQTSIKLPDGARHEHDYSNSARVLIEVEDGGSRRVLSATEVAHSNEIRKEFDIHVIGDMRRIKASAKNMGRFSAATAKQVIDPIIICAKPGDVQSPYKVSVVRTEFGNHSRILLNLDASVFALATFIARSDELMQAISPLLKERPWRKLESLRERISANPGSDEDAFSSVEDDVLVLLNEDVFKAAAKIIADVASLDTKNVFLTLWQLIAVARKDKDRLSAYFECLRYREVKESLKAHIAEMNSGWKEAVVRESGGNLVVEIPEPSNLSNGQRDIILLVSMFHVAKCQLKKRKAILIIDEVFDYLDDANLTVAQFYISELIEDYKRQGRLVYPIILTHLNPAFFKNYVFCNQKVIYLDKSHAYDSIDAMKKLIASRSDPAVADDLKDNISKYLLHYHSASFDFCADLGSIKGVRTSWGRSDKFQEFLTEEFGKYERGEPYDPLAICAVTRRAIESLAYQKISHLMDSAEFFNTWKTGPKLDWASRRGAVIPEFHYLLRVIFDDGLHWNLARDNTIPIVAKLGNPIIRKLVIRVVSEAFSGSLV